MALTERRRAAREAIESKSFWVVKRADDDERLWSARAEEIVQLACDYVRLSDGTVDWGLISSGPDVLGRAETFLAPTIKRVCRRAPALTVVVERYHVDDVYRDMESSRDARDYFVKRRWCLRLALFARELDPQTFFALPGRSEPWERGRDVPGRVVPEGPGLQESLVGCIVVAPLSGATVGRTLIDPRWLLGGPCSVRLSDYEVTVRGKRLVVPAWPWRAQDGEVMSCAETSLLGLSCYFSNQYREYPYALPTDLLERLEDPDDGTPRSSQGLDLEQMGRVVTSMGLRARTYAEDTLLLKRVPGDARSHSEELRSVARAYVDSGLPVVAMVQPAEGKVGHAVTLIGLSDTWLPADDDIWNRCAERMSSSGRTLCVMDVSDFDSIRPFVVSDDASGPYERRLWPSLSTFGSLAATSILVPTARQVRLGALDARELAMDVLRSDSLGICARAGGLLGEGARLVLQQRLVSAASYLRFRTQTCDAAMSAFWELLPWPGYLWLFEVLEADQASLPGWPRRAVAEIVFDACSRGHDEMTSGLVFLRYPGFAHYHAPDGSSETVTDGVPWDFPAFDRAHRHVGPIDDGTV